MVIPTFLGWRAGKQRVSSAGLRLAVLEFGGELGLCQPPGPSQGRGGTLAGAWSLCPQSLLGFSLEFRDFLRLNRGLVSGISLREGPSGGGNTVPLLAPPRHEGRTV